MGVDKSCLLLIKEDTVIKVGKEWLFIATVESVFFVSISLFVLFLFESFDVMKMIFRAFKVYKSCVVLKMSLQKLIKLR